MRNDYHNLPTSYSAIIYHWRNIYAVEFHGSFRKFKDFVAVAGNTTPSTKGLWTSSRVPVEETPEYYLPWHNGLQRNLEKYFARAMFTQDKHTKVQGGGKGARDAQLNVAGMARAVITYHIVDARSHTMHRVLLRATKYVSIPFLFAYEPVRENERRLACTWSKY